MYILIPIGLLVISIAGILYLAGRKFVYLKKLTPEAISDPPATAGTFWSHLLPEVAEAWGSIRWREYRVLLTAEFEKFLRRIRLLFLKIDTLTHRLINRLRRETKHHEAILVQEDAKAEEQSLVDEGIMPIALDPKEEEQHLIMEIAKDPKNPDLYRRLGDIYLQTKEFDSARLSFQTVLELEPNDWYAKSKLRSLPRPK